MNSETYDLAGLRAALAAAGDPWLAGPTRFTQMTREERRRLLGVRPPPGAPSIADVARDVQAHKAERAAAGRVKAVGAPSAFDLRNVGGANYVTPVRNQGGCGSCVAFGTLAAVESTMRLQRGDPNLAADLSESHLFHCMGPGSGGASCNNGWWPTYALDLLRNQGVVDEACYPYLDNDAGCGGLCGDAANRVLKTTGWQDLTGNPAAIKEWVSTRGAVTACFIVYDDFFAYQPGQVYRNVVQSADPGGHCVAIVGYDDAAGYWICKNSWNTWFGDQGYFLIGYGEVGIDSWGNFGVTGIENTGWQTDTVVGLWTINEERNAWVYFSRLGWRKVSPDSDAIFLDQLMQLATAKASGSQVSFYELQSVIKQMYVF